MNRILGVYDKSIFEIEDNFLIVTFPFEEGYSSVGVKDGVKVGVKDGVKVGVKDGVKTDMNENQTKIVSLIHENNSITIPQMAQLSRLSVRTVQRELKVLIEKSIIVREGGRKAGVWKLF